MKKIRALVLIPSFYPQAGGAETNVFETSKWLTKNGCKVTIVTQNVKGCPFQESKENIHIIRCGYLDSEKWPKLAHFNTFVSMLLEINRNEACRRPNIVHAHMAHYPLLVGLVAKFLTGAKLFVTMHGSDMNIYGQKFPFKTVMALALRGADKVLVVSKDLGDEAKKLGVPESKIIHLSNGVDTKFFSPKLSEDYSFHISYFGGIKWMKGLDYLIEAIEMLNNQGRRLKVAIAGNGPYLTELKNKVSVKKLDNNITFVGKLNTFELRELIWQSRLIIFPSISEGLPCSLLEAMACSKPVIATDVGGVGEVLNSNVNGLLVPPKNPFALSESILFLLDDPKLQERLANMARKSVINTRDWINVSQQIMSEYLKVLNA